mmetsp:Transcript_34080/g.96594  ORF Transcript_34080/g.96594 Transcript_34080/m.96594 type:complete len:232 (+) Transcript_34080:392-1087(+)
MRTAGFSSVQGQTCLLRLRGKLHLASQPNRLEQRHQHPGHVNLPPLEAMPGTELKGVVVVVPTLTEGQDTDPPVVAAQIACVIVLTSPHVGSAVDKPCHMVDPHSPEGATPHEGREATKGIQNGQRGGDVDRVGLLDEPVEPLLGQVRGVGAVREALIIGSVVKQPSGMAPPEALIGGVGVKGGVTVQVVVTVAAGPLDGVALDRQDAAVSQRVLEPLGRLEAPVAELAVE